MFTWADGSRRVFGWAVRRVHAPMLPHAFGGATRTYLPPCNTYQRTYASSAQMNPPAVDAEPVRLTCLTPGARTA